MYNTPAISKIKKQQTGTVLIKKAQYLQGYQLRIVFSDGKQTNVNFENFINSAEGYLTKYQKPANFKKFKIQNGNLVWGKDWDLIFPIHHLYKGEIIA